VFHNTISFLSKKNNFMIAVCCFVITQKIDIIGTNKVKYVSFDLSKCINGIRSEKESN